MKFSRLAPVALLLLWSGAALAAKGAYVGIASDGGSKVVLRAGPFADAKAVATLHTGDPIDVSNYPTHGFYKARTDTGAIGWIAVTSVSNTEPQVPAQTTESSSFPESSAAEPSIPAVPSAPQAQAPAPTPQQNETIPYEDVENTSGEGEEVSHETGPRTPFEIKAFGGVLFLSSAPSVSGLGVTLGSSMSDFGGQFGLPVSDRVYVLFRVEHLSGSSSQGGYNFSLSGTPLMTGLSYSFLKPETKVRLRGAILLGVAFSTTLDATATSLSAPNTTELETQAFTEMLTMDFEIPVVRAFAFYAELGYRFLDSSSIGPSQTVNGSSSFQPMSLDLSGAELAGGVAIYL